MKNEVAFPIPRSLEEWAQKRKSPSTRSLNDLTEDCMTALIGDPEFSEYTDAIYDSQSKEGKLIIDDVEAARRLRQYAIENNIPRLATEKLSTIISCMNVVLRRYGLSRAERRGMLGGTVVNAE